MRTPTPPLIVALAAAGLLAGCPGGGSSAPQTGEALDQIQARGKFVIATDAGYVPFEVVEEDGTITGFDVDIANAIAEDLGVELQIKNVRWATIIGELKTGRVDAILSGMSITDEREEQVAFSRPYFHVGQVVVKRKGDDRIQSWEDLDQPGMTVAVQEGTTGEFAAREKMPRAELIRFTKTDEACLAVMQEKADAVVFDHPFLQRYVEQQPDALEGIWEPFTLEPIGIAVRKDSPELQAAIDATLRRLEESGRMDALKAKYFESLPGEGLATPGGDGEGAAGGGE